MSSLSIPDRENPRKIEFYNLDVSTLNGPWRELLREYSGIPDGEVDGHVEAMVSLQSYTMRKWLTWKESESIQSGKIHEDILYLLIANVN